MGTNYYAYVPGIKDPYVLCAEEETKNLELHIGKSSGGWCFSVHIIPERGINTLEDWVKFLTNFNAVIKDEYGDAVTIDYLLEVIKERSWRKREPDDFPNYWYQTEEEMLDKNYAEFGPNNLLRHSILDGHCVQQGAPDETWDYIIGDFS